MSGKSCDFSTLRLTPEILANWFSPVILGYIKHPLLVDGEGEMVGANGQGAQTGRAPLWSRSVGVFSSQTTSSHPRNGKGEKSDDRLLAALPTPLSSYDFHGLSTGAGTASGVGGDARR